MEKQCTSGRRDTERVLPKCAGISMIDDRATVAIIDSDDSSRERLRVLLESAGFMVEPLASAEAYLETNRARHPNCIVLDARLRGRSGLDLQAQLAKATWQIPLVFITAQDDVRTSVQAMKAGAIEYLTKPFRNQEVLDAVRTGIARDCARRAEDQVLCNLKISFRSLSLRERQTMALMSAGRTVKQIGGQMGVCTHTARVHGNRVMLKMGARSIASLVRMADKLGLGSDEAAIHPRFDIERICPTDCIRAAARPSKGNKRADHPLIAGRDNFVRPATSPS
jgi:FixJ family two-component response regulator